MSYNGVNYFSDMMTLENNTGNIKMLDEIDDNNQIKKHLGLIMF